MTAKVFALLLATTVAIQTTYAADTPCDSVVCPMDYNPVCASNGVTYSNECMFGVAKCKNKALTMAAKSACTTAMPTPAPTTQCNAGCNKMYKPVCGSDGVTYSNQCVFNYVKCSEPGKRTITMVSEGACPEARSADDTEAADCNMLCTQDYAPVCGTDFVTYSNECMLGVAKCRTRNAKLSVMQTGACPACTTVCVADYAPVCGSDGVTYSNSCRFEAARCTKRDGAMKIVKQGPCAAKLRH